MFPQCVVEGHGWADVVGGLVDGEDGGAVFVGGDAEVLALGEAVRVDVVVELGGWFGAVGGVVVAGGGEDGELGWVVDGGESGCVLVEEDVHFWFVGGGVVVS